jgi:hypothetical protein
VAAKVGAPQEYHFNEVVKMIPREEAQGYHFAEVGKMVPTGEAQPQGGQAGQAGGVVIRFPVERRR